MFVTLELGKKSKASFTIIFHFVTALRKVGGHLVTRFKFSSPLSFVMT